MRSPDLNKLKYPRTYHFEWSEGKSSDDKTLFDLSNFINKEIVITEKMDGENTTMMNECIYARSHDSNNHPSRNWVKGLWGNIKHEIPENWRICGENLYARHSIEYKELTSYFMVFSIWDENNFCLSFDDTIGYCKMLNLEMVPLLYKGLFNIEFVKQFKINPETQEGFVMRVAGKYSSNDFNKSVVKWVRKGHVQDEEHWMFQKLVPNKLKL